MELLEAPACIGGPDAFATVGLGTCLGQSGAIVQNLDANAAWRRGQGPDDDGHGPCDGFDAVLDGVFNKGLQEEVGDGLIHQGGIDVALDG
jgi:hypothetical protein